MSDNPQDRYTAPANPYVPPGPSYAPPGGQPAPAGGAPLYYVAKNNQQTGPYSLQDIERYIASGQIAASDLGWTQGMAAWAPLSQMLNLQTPILPGAPYANPAYTAQTPQYAGAAAYMAPVERMGFWIRVGAYLIDSIILFVVALIAGIVIGLLYAMGGGKIDPAQNPIANILGIVISWLYFSVFESSPLQATPGKLALGMKVTDFDGNRIGFVRATGRYFGKFLSGLLFGYGFIIIGTKPEKLGWHDQLASTQVIRR